MADVVSFTGSTARRRSAWPPAATARGIAGQAEMGGLNASIVLPDADVEAAAKVIAGAAMGYAGQKCTATGRVIVLGDPAEFTDALAAAVEALPVGDPADGEHRRRPGHQPAGARRARRRPPTARRATAAAS